MVESKKAKLASRLKVLKAEREKERAKRRKRKKPDPDVEAAPAAPETLYLWDPYQKPVYVEGRVLAPTITISVKEWERARKERRRSRNEKWYVVMNPPPPFPPVTVWRLRKYLKTVGKPMPEGRGAGMKRKGILP